MAPAEFLVLCQSSDRIVWVHEATIVRENATGEIPGEDVLASHGCHWTLLKAG